MDAGAERKNQHVHHPCATWGLWLNAHGVIPYGKIIEYGTAEDMKEKNRGLSLIQEGRFQAAPCLDFGGVESRRLVY